MAGVTLDTAYFRTARNAPPLVRAALAEFIARLEALPAPAALPGDVEVSVPPIARFWRHTFGATGWCVHYTVRTADVFVRNVTTLKAP